MSQLSAQETQMLRGIASHFPEFVTFLERRREGWRDALEQGGSELIRGRALELKDLTATIAAAKNAR